MLFRSVRGYADGRFQIRSHINGEVLGEVKVRYTNVWEEYECNLIFPDGVQSIYLTYVGNGIASLYTIELE